jgi:hypothetical protein
MTRVYSLRLYLSAPSRPSSIPFPQPCPALPIPFPSLLRSNSPWHWRDPSPQALLSLLHACPANPGPTAPRLVCRRPLFFFFCTTDFFFACMHAHWHAGGRNTTSVANNAVSGAAHWRLCLHLALLHPQPRFACCRPLTGSGTFHVTDCYCGMGMMHSLAAGAANDSACFPCTPGTYSNSSGTCYVRPAP